jgi:hypothetical protein
MLKRVQYFGNYQYQLKRIKNIVGKHKKKNQND